MIRTTTVGQDVSQYQLQKFDEKCKEIQNIKQTAPGGDPLGYQDLLWWGRLRVACYSTCVGGAEEEKAYTGADRIKKLVQRVSRPGAAEAQTSGARASSTPRMPVVVVWSRPSLAIWYPFFTSPEAPPKMPPTGVETTLLCFFI